VLGDGRELRLNGGHHPVKLAQTASAWSGVCALTPLIKSINNIDRTISSFTATLSANAAQSSESPARSSRQYRRRRRGPGDPRDAIEAGAVEVATGASGD
jgi:hypothetical protein